MRDMYGNEIYELGDTGFGVSVSYYSQHGPKPSFTFFHKGDDYQQALFSVDLLDNNPRVVGRFHDRIAEWANHVRLALEWLRDA